MPDRRVSGQPACFFINLVPQKMCSWILRHARGVEVARLIHGGIQERDCRAGTENLPVIVGFARAFGEAEIEKLLQAISPIVEGLRRSYNPYL